MGLDEDKRVVISVSRTEERKKGCRVVRVAERVEGEEGE